MAGPVLVHDNAMIQGDKFLYSLDEGLNSDYRVARKYVPTQPGEQVGPVFVTNARVDKIEAMQDSLLFVTYFNGPNGDWMLVGWSLTRKLWERKFTAAQAQSRQVFIDSKKNVLLRYGPYTSILGVYDIYNVRWAYLNGLSGETVGEFGLSHLLLNRENYLAGYNYAKTHPGTRADGYYAGQGWNFNLNDYNYGTDSALPQPPGTWPDYMKNTKECWGYPSLLQNDNGWVLEHIVPTSNGWLALRTESFHWIRHIKEDNNGIFPPGFEREWHMATVQYARAAIEGALPNLRVSYEIEARARVLLTDTGYYSTNEWLWEFQLVRETGSANRIADTLVTSNITHGDYTPTDVVAKSGALGDWTNTVNAKIIAALGEVWVYSNKEGADFRNYHKISNEGDIIESLANPILPANQFLTFSERSNFALVGAGQTELTKVYDLDGVDVTPPLESPNDTIEYCYAVTSKDFLKVKDASALGTEASFDQIWGRAPGGWEKLARIRRHPFFSTPAKQVEFGGQAWRSNYLGNGFDLGRTAGLTTPNKYHYHFNDFAAGGSVAYLFLPKTLVSGSATYNIDPTVHTRRAQWYDVNYP